MTYDSAFRAAEAAKAAEKVLGSTVSHRQACKLYLDAIDAFTRAVKLEPNATNRKMVEGQIAEFSQRARELGKRVQASSSPTTRSAAAGFIASARFTGPRAGHVFKRGAQGQGYYSDARGYSPAAAASQSFSNSSSADAGGIAWPEVPTTAPKAPASAPKPPDLALRINNAQAAAEARLQEARRLEQQMNTSHSQHRHT